MFKSKIFPGTNYYFSDNCVSVSSERVSVMALEISELHPGLPGPSVSPGFLIHVLLEISQLHQVSLVPLCLQAVSHPCPLPHVPSAVCFL